MSLDRPEAFERADPHGVRDVLAGFPRQCREGLALRATPGPATDCPEAVIVAAMGGSAAAGDLLAACGEGLDVPVHVHRDYGLPALGRARALVVAASYSGETAEVLSAVEVALARGLPVVTLATGGRLAAVAAARGLPRVALPGGLMPRLALGHLFFAAFGVLRDLGLPVVTENAVGEALAALETLAAELGPGCPTARNEAKQLALAVGPRLPVVYGGPATAPVAYRWKTDLEENAKVFALAGALPEVNHNELEAWRAPAARGMHALLLRDREEPPEISRRFAVLRELIAPAAGGVSEARGRGRSRLARLLTLAYLGQWTSYYLAVLRGSDPWTVPLLDEMKRRLARAGGEAGAAPGRP